MDTTTEKRHKLSSAQIIALSFILIIAVGTLLLALPVSSKSGAWTNPLDAFFTATSATCVTGLIVFDTYTHFTVFGQIVILLLIQIGGLGFLTVITMFSAIAKRRISLHERKLLMQSAGTMQLNGITTMIRRILIGTAIFEGAGTILLSIRFCPQYGLWEGIYNAAFHSVSAFCNAGFDLMGKNGAFSSLTSYSGDPLVSLTICALIVIGGIGFLVWTDFVNHRFHFREYSLHSKIALTTTAILILSGWVGIYFSDRNEAMTGMGEGEKILSALFQSVTARTAGFNTIDQAKLSDSGSAVTMILMLVGGSPGSTAGGIKTTTLAVMMLNMISSTKNLNGVTVFKKRIDDRIIRQAFSVVTLYIGVVLVVSLVIVAIEPFGLTDVLFEVISAICTVGVSKGITPSLCDISKILIALVIYTGRIGGLSFALVFFENRQPIELSRPAEKIIVG